MSLCCRIIEVYCCISSGVVCDCSDNELLHRQTIVLQWCVWVCVEGSSETGNVMPVDEQQMDCTDSQILNDVVEIISNEIAGSQVSLPEVFLGDQLIVTPG